MYMAFDKFTIAPSHLNVSATSGTAASTVVDDIGARKLQNDTTAVMTILRLGEKRW